MNKIDCQLLEEYLAGALDDHSQHNFEAHLAACQTCQSQIALQQSVELALLKANAAVDMPAGLVDRVERRVRQASRTRRLAIGSLASAALLLVAGIVALGTYALGGGSSPEKQAARDRWRPLPNAPAGETTAEDRLVEVTFPASQNIVANQIETTDPTVTILMVYPAVRPASLEQRSPSF